MKKSMLMLNILCIWHFNLIESSGIQDKDHHKDRHIIHSQRLKAATEHREKMDYKKILENCDCSGNTQTNEKNKCKLDTSKFDIRNKNFATHFKKRFTKKK